MKTTRKSLEGRFALFFKVCAATVTARWTLNFLYSDQKFLIKLPEADKHHPGAEGVLFADLDKLPSRGHGGADRFARVVLVPFERRTDGRWLTDRCRESGVWCVLHKGQ